MTECNMNHDALQPFGKNDILRTDPDQSESIIEPRRTEFISTIKSNDVDERFGNQIYQKYINS